MMLARTRTGLALLTRATLVEAALWRRLRFESDPTSRERLFDQYLTLARAVARGEFRRRPAYGLEQADFEQLAIGGLLEAIDRYDPLRGAPFAAFARPRIRGAIADGLAQASEASAQFNHRRRIELERLRSLRSETTAIGDDPIAELTALAAGLAIGLIAERATLEGGPAFDTAPSFGAYETLAWRELQISVLREIDQLPSAEKTVLQQHYLHSVPFVEIARLLAVSKGRVSQLHHAALQRLRSRLRVDDKEAL